MKNNYLEEILPRFEAVKAEMNLHFEELTEEQLNWKSNRNQWSIGQCIDHLVTSNSTYFPTFQALVEGRHARRWLERVPFWASFGGRILLESIQPVPNTKTKSPKAFMPTQGGIPADILRKYGEQQARLLDFLIHLDKLDHDQTIVTSPASPFITYTLKANIQILANHEERHLYQAKEIKKHAAFPIYRSR